MTWWNCSLISGLKMSPCLALERASAIFWASTCCRSMIVFPCVVDFRRGSERSAALCNVRYSLTRCVKSSNACDSCFTGEACRAQAAAGTHPAPASPIKKTTAPATIRQPFSSSWTISLTACFRSEEHTSELQSHVNLVCRLLLEKQKKKIKKNIQIHQKTKQYAKTE